jgi:hypothetical protein
MANTNSGDNLFVGAVNDSSFKNKGNGATLSNQSNGEKGWATRTSSPNQKPEVTKVTFDRLQKPTR